MQDLTITLPRLNGLNPSLESACIKLCEELGEVARIIGKGQGLNGESSILNKQRFINELGTELFDVAQSAMTMLYLFQDQYNFDLNIFYGRHISKLVSKGYLKLGDDFMLDKIYDELGNIINLAVPDCDLITKEDSEIVVQAKKDVQAKLWDHIYNQEGEENEIQ